MWYCKGENCYEIYEPGIRNGKGKDNETIARKRDKLANEINGEITKRVYSATEEPSESHPFKRFEICGYSKIKSELTKIQKGLKDEGWTVKLEHKKSIDVYMLEIW